MMWQLRCSNVLSSSKGGEYVNRDMSGSLYPFHSLFIIEFKEAHTLTVTQDTTNKSSRQTTRGSR